MSLTSKIISFAGPFSPTALTEYQIQLPPKANQVIVEVLATALNPVDLKVKPYLPFGGLVGRDYSGIIRHVGTEASKKFKVGDRVFGFVYFPRTSSDFVGSYAVVDITKSPIAIVPKDMKDIDAAAAPLTLLTAWDVLNQTQVAPAGKVLVLGGATAVGTFAIQLLKEKYNVAKVVATCSAKSADYVKSYGADETVDYSGDLNAKLLETVKDGKYVAIVDAVGEGPVGAIANQLVAEPWADSDKGNFTSCAGSSPPSSSGYGMLSLFAGLPRLVLRMLFGKFWGIRYKFVSLSTTAWPEAVEFLQSNPIKVPIDSVVRYDDALSAVERLQKAKLRGKIVIQF